MSVSIFGMFRVYILVAVFAAPKGKIKLLSNLDVLNHGRNVRDDNEHRKSFNSNVLSGEFYA